VSDWQSLDPATLDREYNARATVPDIEAELRAYRDLSAPMYTHLDCRRGLQYGPSADEQLDLFPVPGQPGAPLFLFIHGGYWRALGKEDSVFMAQNFTAQGIAVAALDYSLAPGAHLSQMVDQCRRAVAWLHGRSADLGVDSRRMVVAGSSAGAHLAAMLLASGWQAGLGVPADVVRAGLLVSGLYDLAPLRRTLPQSWLHLSESDVQRLSPQHHLPDPACPLHVVVAQRDTGEFKRQSRDYARACAGIGCPTMSYEVEGRNHFDVVLDWTLPGSALTRSVVSLLSAYR
jgi:arylformamidase